MNTSSKISGRHAIRTMPVLLIAPPHLEVGSTKSVTAAPSYVAVEKGIKGNGKSSLKFLGGFMSNETQRVVNMLRSLVDAHITSADFAKIDGKAEIAIVHCAAAISLEQAADWIEKGMHMDALGEQSAKPLRRVGTRI